MDNILSIIARPPWSLHGKGYILLYRFEKEFVEKNGFLPEGLLGKFRGIVGSVMLVDYSDSPVGAYQELLFIPGLFQFKQRKAFHISKIYVSTYDSVYNGIENWGIPKELADFRWEKAEKGFERFVVEKQGRNFFSAELKAFGIPFYINTAWLPFHFYQWRRGTLLHTTPQGKGWAKLCKVQNIQVHSDLFPDISKQKLLAAISVPHFTMNFPEPKQEMLLKRLL
ncbi:acetoacetate decarboxylase family protein [Raineya sp.]|jgi:glycosyltransferase involved in cell wall biosynthesis